MCVVGRSEIGGGEVVPLHTTHQQHAQLPGRVI